VDINVIPDGMMMMMDAGEMVDAARHAPAPHLSLKHAASRYAAA